MTVGKINHLTVIAVAFLMLASQASGKVPTTEGLSPSEPGANLTFGKGYKAGLMVSAIQTYLVSADGTCNTLGWFGMFSMTTPKEKIFRVPVGVPTYFFSRTVYFYTSHIEPNGFGTSVYVSQASCAHAASFTPEEGHNYSVKQMSRLGAQECPFEIVDMTTGAAVSDIQPAAGLADCVEKNEKGSHQQKESE